MDENEITKIFVLTGQALTLFSEYNFNHSLKLSPFLIEEIYHAESNGLWTLDNQCAERYASQLNSVLQECIGNQVCPLTQPLIELHNSRELAVYGYKYH
ncbi:hypothetical protein [Legionella genomosp. 1]|uniref:hypothetical protein n=1 Tax=Legionella genomosp. 1 TaxID=1093625 RepID=UPI0010544106|nr:hypothetical protein [Legionella genomosp. 1]